MSTTGLISIGVSQAGAFEKFVGLPDIPFELSDFDTFFRLLRYVEKLYERSIRAAKLDWKSIKLHICWKDGDGRKLEISRQNSGKITDHVTRLAMASKTRRQVVRCCISFSISSLCNSIEQNLIKHHGKNTFSIPCIDDDPFHNAPSDLSGQSMRRLKHALLPDTLYSRYEKEKNDGNVSATPMKTMEGQEAHLLIAEAGLALINLNGSVVLYLSGRLLPPYKPVTNVNAVVKQPQDVEEKNLKAKETSSIKLNNAYAEQRASTKMSDNAKRSFATPTKGRSSGLELAKDSIDSRSSSKASVAGGGRSKTAGLKLLGPTDSVDAAKPKPQHERNRRTSERAANYSRATPDNQDKPITAQSTDTTACEDVSSDDDNPDSLFFSEHTL